jgi:two-component system phosphate regulon sensor histidine kinase PhoR
MLFFMGRVTFLESILVWVLSISITLLIIRNDLAFIFKLEKNLSKKIKVLEKGELPSQVFNNFLNTNIFNNLGNKFSTFEEKYQSKLSEFIKEINQNSVLIDSLPVAIISFSKNYNILKANKIALDVLGKDIINFDIRHIFRHPEVSETIENVLENKSKNRNITIEVFGLPLQIWSLQVLVFSDLNKEYDKIQSFQSNEPVGVILMTNQTLEKQLEKTRADFVANVSHELRTPLTSILGYTETLMSSAGEDKALRKKFLKIIEKQSKRMTRLVSDQLSLAKIESEEHVIPNRSVNLKKVIYEVLKSFEDEIINKKIKLDLKIDKKTKNVQGDKDELFQVLQNLLENAIRYGGNKSEIVVSLKRAEKRPANLPKNSWPAICCEVSDNGPGINKVHLGRLTERFYRVDASRSKEIGGTGLGLAIVKHIINRHRGSLIIESEPSIGSKFFVYLKENKTK